MGGAILEPDREEAPHGVVTATQRAEGRRGGAGGRSSRVAVISDGAGAEPHEAEPAEEQQAARRLDDCGGAADSRDESGDGQSALSQPSAVGHDCLMGKRRRLLLLDRNLRSDTQVQIQ